MLNSGFEFLVFQGISKHPAESYRIIKRTVSISGFNMQMKPLLQETGAGHVELKAERMSADIYK